MNNFAFFLASCGEGDGNGCAGQDESDGFHSVKKLLGFN
jgi:hypothetical protein